MRATVEDLDAHASWVSIYVTQGQKEAAFAKDEVIEARQEATIVREVMRTAEDVVAAVADDVQDIDLQAGFKVFRQVLL